jgi:hypothetical protein
MEEAITSLLAGVASGRRYWGRAPQTAPRPFVVLTRVGGQRDYVMQGPSGYVASRVQVDCYADTYDAAKTTGRAAVAVLSGHRSGDILGIFVESERDLPASDAGEVNHLFRVSIDVMVHHREA